MLLTLPAPPSAGCLREGPLYYEVTLLPSSTSYHQLLLAEGPSFHHPEKLSTTSGQTLFSHLHFWSQTAWIQIQHLPHTSCATLGESPHSSSEITFVDSFKAKMFFILWSEGDRSWQGFFFPVSSFGYWKRTLSLEITLGKIKSQRSSFGPLFRREKLKS